MHRRDVLHLLGSSVVAGLSLDAVTSRLAEAGSDATGARFAVRSPLVGETLADRMALAAQLGYDGIELGGKWFDPPAEEIRRTAQQAGIAVVGGGVGGKLIDLDPEVRTQSVANGKRNLHKAKAAGARMLVCVPVFGKETKFPAVVEGRPHREVEIDQVVAGLKQLAPVAEEVGVDIAIEPLNRKETYLVNRLEQGLEVVRRVGSRRVGILADFYHMQLEEKDIPAALELAFDHIKHVHAADGEARTVPGSLPFDYRPGFAVLKRKGYDGYISIEARPSGDVTESLKESLAYLKQRWAEA